MKRILHISFMVVLLAGAVFLLAFTDQEHQRRTYRDFRIDVLNASEMAMITSDEIKELIVKRFGEIEGSPITGIDLNELESFVTGNPYVSSCEVFQTIGGELILKTRVRAPLVRIINEEGKQYYLDYTGCAMPLNPDRPSHVLIANGRIRDHYVSLDKSERPLSTFPDSSVLHQVYPIVYHISADEFLNSFIDQVYVKENMEIELVPKIGSQTIIFGSSIDAREKLENLKTFYREVMSNMDWNVYKSINLKYKNQVVCSKYIQYE